MATGGEETRWPLPRKLVTLTSSCNSGASLIASSVAEILGIKCFDRIIPESVARILGVDPSRCDSFDERPPSLLLRLAGANLADPSAWAASGGHYEVAKYWRTTEIVLGAIADSNQGVIVGRGSSALLRSHPAALHVRIDADIGTRVRRFVDRHECDERTAIRAIRRIDRGRATYHAFYYGVDVRDARRYDLTVNTATMSHDLCTDLIVSAALRGTPASETIA